jgi:SM-20-related protein
MNSEDSLLNSLDQSGWGFADNVIPPEVVELLRNESQKLWQSGRFHSAHIGKGATKAVRPEIRGDAICWLEAFTSEDQDNPGIQKFFVWAKAFRQTLNQRYFLSLNNEEFHFARYPANNGYAKHIDQHRGTQERKISLVLYLNPEWPPQAGGELAIYSADNDSQIQQRIQPSFGRLVLFRSDLIPHEVLPCFQTRWSLTGWFRAEVQSLV